MDKYIKEQDLIDRIYPIDPDNDGSDGCTVIAQNITLSSQEIEALVDEIPPADVTQIVHARWEMKPTFMGNISCCSECGNPAPETNYCPNCGAKMDLTGDNA